MLLRRFIAVSAVIYAPAELATASPSVGGRDTYSKIGFNLSIQTLPEFYSTSLPFRIREACRRGDLGADGGIMNRFSGPLQVVAATECDNTSPLNTP